MQETPNTQKQEAFQNIEEAEKSQDVEETPDGSGPFVLTGTGERLDVLLASSGLVTRQRAQALLKDGLVRVDGVVQHKPSAKPAVGSKVAFSLPCTRQTPLAAQDLALNILYQDADIAVIDKPCGMVVHPANGNPDGTLVNALLFHLDGLSGVGGELRPGIVHRLDKDTSGLMLVAKNDRAHVRLAQQLAERSMEKHYLAVVAGKMKDTQGTVDKPIGRSEKDRKKMTVTPTGRPALTYYTVLEQRENSALLDVRIVTGRTHQIRVHMASLHHPVLGDPIYGVKNMPAAPRLMLHAFSLQFTHPTTGERLRFTCMPEEKGFERASVQPR